jgi:branched-subunit amino acid aminotransferase/4-amino-4-deoxychorismate lyase
VAEPLVYLNGAMIPASQAHLAVHDIGIVMGATVSEQTRTFRKKLFRLDDHLDRLFFSANIARIEIGLTKAELARISNDLIAHNASVVCERDELGLIHFVTAGEHPVFANTADRPARSAPTVCAHTYRLPFELWTKKMQEGTHLITPAIRQPPPESYDPWMKCRSRMHYYLAEKEAQSVDPEASALLLNLHGNVTETNAANFFIVEGQTIVSPIQDDILPGISRAMVIELALKLGIPWAEKDIGVGDIIRAGEAFLSSTGFCLMPVAKINNLPIGDGNPGPVFRQLLRAWSQSVGLDIEKQIMGKVP